MNFLQEYEELCEKYKVFINGCGCCDSPYIMELKENSRFEFEYSLRHIKEIAEKDKLSLENKEKAKE